MSPVKYPVRLSEGRVESFSDFINVLFEYGLFFKWIYFKNRPRGNLLFLRSSMMVSAFSALFFSFFYDFGLVLEGIEIDPIIAFAGAIVVGYWHMTNTFYKKSKVCNELYVEILKAAGKEDHKTMDLLSNSLAIDLLTLDLWAHRKFSELFADELHKSLITKGFHQDQSHLPKGHEELVHYINQGKLQVKDVRKLLHQKRHDLLSKNSHSTLEKASA